MAAASPPPNSLPTTPGTIVAGKYRVERLLGKGGMGLVVEARHLALDERVALKFLLPAFASHPEAAARFMREARAVFKIKSEHVVRVMDVATLDDGAPYMVLEFLEGADLLRLLKTQGTVPVDDAIDYVIQACDAIGEAHSHGIIHRDVKPSNLFLMTGRDGMPVIKVLDFGISKVVGVPGIDALTRTTTTMGSAHYMSPEQMRSIRDVDHRTDIYALGVTLFTLISGKHPYNGKSIPQVYSEILTGEPKHLRQLRPEIPEHFAGVVAKAYLRDPGARYQSIAELVFALAPYAPPRSRSTIERIARLVGRPGPVVRSEPPPPVIDGGHARAATPYPQAAADAQPRPALEEAASGDPQLTISDEAKTRLLPPRAPAQLTGGEPLRIPMSKGPAVAVAAIVALVMLMAGGALIVQWRKGTATAGHDVRPIATSEATPRPPESTTSAEAPATAEDPEPLASAGATSPARASADPAAKQPGSPATTTATTTPRAPPGPPARASATASASAKAAPAPSSEPPPPPSGEPRKTIFDDR